MLSERPTETSKHQEIYSEGFEAKEDDDYHMDSEVIHQYQHTHIYYYFSIVFTIDAVRQWLE